MKVITNDAPESSGVVVFKNRGAAYAGEPDGHAYVPSADGHKTYRVTMRPGKTPSVWVIRDGKRVIL